MKRVPKLEITICPGCGNPTVKYPSTNYCGKCINKYDYNKEHVRNKADCRNNDLDPGSSPGFGYMNEVLVAKYLGIKTCFDITGVFNYHGYDLLEHDDWGLINAKGSKLLNECNHRYHTFNINKNKKPDFFFCVGYDEYRKHVLTVYYIPNDDCISQLDKLYINLDWSPEENPYYWLKEDPKPWDNLFHSLKLNNCPVLRPRNIEIIRQKLIGGICHY